MQFQRLAFLLLSLAAHLHVNAGPIHDAAKEGELEKVKELVTKDPQAVNDKDTDGDTPLHEAVRKGHKDIVVYLLSNKADPDAVAKNGMTPKKLAKGYSRPDLLALLEGKVAHKDGQASLTLTASTLENIKEVKLLQDGRVLIYHEQGATPLPLTNCPTEFLVSWNIEPEEAKRLEDTSAKNKEAQRLGLPTEDNRPKFTVKQGVICNWATNAPWNTKAFWNSEAGETVSSKHYNIASFLDLPKIRLRCLFSPETGQLKQAMLPCGYSYPGSSGFNSTSEEQEKLDEHLLMITHLMSLVSTNAADTTQAKQWLKQVVKVVYEPRHRFLVRDLEGASIYVVETMSYYVGATEFRGEGQETYIFVTPRRAKVIVPASLYTGTYQVFNSRGIRSFIPRELASRIEVD